MSVKKMNSPQWKKFQPPSVQDPAILSFHQSPSNVINSPTATTTPTTTTTTTTTTTATTPATGAREKGFIDKRQHSYGFIQCCDKDARLFFHFSEYNGNIDSMQVGEPVEFSISSDRRTGKPIAVAVARLDQQALVPEVVSDERFVGTVIQEAKPSKGKNGTVPGNQDGFGRVTYEHSGECFFLPYALEDVLEPNVKIKTGDQVMFYISSDQSGHIRARSLELVISPSQRYQGVVCSMKESFGFIERADVVREIFFHYSEFRGNINELHLGDDVEFSIQMRNNKEVAVEIEKLPEGTVIFEDIAIDKVTGKILKTLKGPNNRRQSDPLGGKIIYETPKGTMELPWGDKDQHGDCTLQQGDTVSFNIATDRRDHLQRATNITLLEESFVKSGELRENGVISSLKEGYGFIQCADRDARMFFHYSEFMDSSYTPKCQDEVTFTVMQDPSSANRMVATRIRVLPRGSVSFLTIHPAMYIGTIDREPATHKNQNKAKDPESGNIVFDYEGAIQHITYSVKDVVDQKNMPRYGDKVEFQIGEQKNNGKKVAVNVRVVIRNIMGRCQGFVATLKDNYGFIENSDHDREVFFHFSAFEGNAADLDLGDEVEYTLARKSSKLSAENIRKLSKGAVAPEEMLWDKGILQGKIIRPMRIVDPEQDEYCGLVQVKEDDEENGEMYPYGITSLADKRDFLQKGDIVKFQLARVKNTNIVRATNLAAQRKYIRAKVDSVKGQFGFLNYEVEEGKKLFFHMTEVHDSAQISPGDEVEFVVVQNQRNRKYSACSLRKITEKQRPERLISRLKSLSDENAPRIVVERQPRGPDNTKGFTTPRTPWKPPS